MRRPFFICFFIELSGAVCIVVNSGNRIYTARRAPVQKSKIYAIINQILTIILLVGVVVVGMYMIKFPETRTWGIIIFIGSFVILYTYVVKRRNTQKKK
jgi:L-asparagine transporter-like permease